MGTVAKLIAEVRANPPHTKSPLPWKAHAECGDVSDNSNTGVVADIETDNAAYIVAAANAVGQLVEEVERIWAENEALREEANFYRELHNKTCLTVDKFVYGSCSCHLSVQIERNRSVAMGTSSGT